MTRHDENIKYKFHTLIKVRNWKKVIFTQGLFF